MAKAINGYGMLNSAVVMAVVVIGYWSCHCRTCAQTLSLTKNPELYRDFSGPP